MEASSIFSRDWFRYLFIQTSLDIVRFGHFWTFPNMSDAQACSWNCPIAHLGHFCGHQSECLWQQTNSKIVAIGKCNLAFTAILELITIRVWFLFPSYRKWVKIIPLMIQNVTKIITFEAIQKVPLAGGTPCPCPPLADDYTIWVETGQPCTEHLTIAT